MRGEELSFPVRLSAIPRWESSLEQRTGASIRGTNGKDAQAQEKRAKRFEAARETGRSRPKDRDADYEEVDDKKFGIQTARMTYKSCKLIEGCDGHRIYFRSEIITQIGHLGKRIRAGLLKQGREKSRRAVDESSDYRDGQ